MGLTLAEFLNKLTADEIRLVTSALSDVLAHGHGEVNVKIQNGKIVFATGIKNYKA